MNASSVLAGFVTWAIPLLEVAICILAGRAFYRLVRSGGRRRLPVIAAYLVATSIPVLLGIGIIAAGSYLGRHHRIYAFFGENVWGLGVLTALSLLIALVANAIFCFALLAGSAIKRQETRPPPK